MSRIELIFQIPALAIPMGIVASIVSALSAMLEWGTLWFGFLGAAAGFFVSVMLIIINWKPMVKRGKEYLKKRRKK